MAQIFISHSAKDKEAVDYLSKIFAGTNVRAVFEEYEKLSGVLINTHQIQAHINNSNCVFILLDENVEKLNYTRDWVVWESGFASQMNRDIWLFEKQKDVDKISIVIPSVHHYVSYNLDTNWFPYIKDIIQSYDDSNVITTALASSAIGGAITDKKNKVAGFVMGALTGLVLSNNYKNKRPIGLSIRCCYCDSIYNVHVPPNFLFRCPVCNNRLQLIPT